MKTKHLLLVFIILFSGNLVFAQKMTVNTEKSTVAWQGKKVTGQHEGFIQLKSGSFELKDDKIISGSFIIDMSKISCTDLKDEGYNKKLIGHLKSDDFFGVETYPTAELRITKSDEFKDGIAKVSGDITIKGKTEAISFKVKRVGNKFGTVMLIDRSKFDVKYGSNSFFDNLGDKTIDDLFTLEIKLVLN